MATNHRLARRRDTNRRHHFGARGRRLDVEPLEHCRVKATLAVTTLDDAPVSQTAGDGVVSL